MKYEINIKIGDLEGRCEFESNSEYQFTAQLGYIMGQMIGDQLENLESITIRKVDFLNESNNV